MENRNKVIKFKVSANELDYIKRKAKFSESKNLSCYLRKMAIAGMIINYPADTLKTLQRDMVGIKTNINQIAQRVNSTNNIYYDDIRELQEKVDEIWQSLVSIQSMLHCTKR